MRPLSLYAAPLLLILAACGGGAAESESWHVRVPLGDPAAGRTAFVELGCVSCHGVAGDDRLAPPVSASPGPELGAGWDIPHGGELATDILLPSGRLAAGYVDEDDPRLSPMGDYTRSMTVRELADLVAYIRQRADEQLQRLEEGVGGEQDGIRRPPV